MTYDTSRIRRMRQRMLARPAVCVERCAILTRSFQATEGESAPIRRARAFADLLDQMTIRIEPDELVVGRPTSKVRGGSISPELQCGWILDELDLLSTRDTDPFLPLTDQEKDTLRQVVPYWRTRSVRAKWEQLVPPDSRPYDDLIIGGGAYCGNNQFPGHSSPDYAMILALGVEGARARVLERLARPCTPQQRQELEAMALCLAALGRLGQRYADLAQSMADKEADPVRRRELEQIAANCRQVPARPARTFWEAVQCLWLTYMAVMLENWGTGNTFLRADQYLYPYYRRDREEGRLDGQLAFELCASLLVNCNCACVVYSEQRVHGFAGNNSGCSVTLGGVTPEGACAVNELSYLFLDAEETVCMGSDDLVIRIADNTPDDFLLAACRVARQVGGKLKFLGDRTTVSNLELDHVAPETARDYAIAGCTSPVVGGRVYNVPGGIISLPGILELALNDGVHRMTGLHLGTHTGDCTQFTTFDQLWDAFCAQVRHVIPHCHAIKNADKAAFSAVAPSPFQSALCPVCVEAGVDLIDGGTAPDYFFAMSLAGAPNVGDGLAALKKFVFEEKRVSMARVKAALDTNFEQDPALRALLLSAPKFGNADPYVDRLVDQVLCYVSDVVAAIPGFHEAHSTVAAAAVTANVGLGMVLGATPDGRLAGQPISEGGISPAQGRNTSGITGSMRSVAGLDHTKLRHGEVLNLRIDPKAVEGEDKLHKFADLIRAYVDQGGFLVQFNIVSTDTLRDAQLHPERHRDLVVRVATYAAYFIELGPELQEDIIHRLEMTSL
mgnify:FL=1